MKIYYNNIRGVKSKINSLKEIIDDQKPHIISISETLLGKEDCIDIKNYKFMYNSKKEGKGGIAIGIHKDILKKCMLIEEKSEEYEATWIKLSNNTRFFFYKKHKLRGEPAMFLNFGRKYLRFNPPLP